MTYYVCRWMGESFYDSWVSSLGECIVSGAILCLQISFIKQIAQLIDDSKLDLVPVRRTFCRNLSVVGFIFLVTAAEVGINVLVYIFNSKTAKEQETVNSTPFLVLTLSVTVLQLCAYLGFCRLIWRSTRLGRTFDDLILNQKVPELVYL